MKKKRRKLLLLFNDKNKGTCFLNFGAGEADGHEGGWGAVKLADNQGRYPAECGPWNVCYVI